MLKNQVVCSQYMYDSLEVLYRAVSVLVGLSSNTALTTNLPRSFLFFLSTTLGIWRSSFLYVLFF